MQITYASREHNIDLITEYVLDQRGKNPSYRVVDLGGSRVGWTRDIADVIVDLDEASDLSFDLSQGWAWQPLVNLVQQQGLFDLCICTHTLEDLYNPQVALEFMPKIARSGYITAPTVATELSYVQSLNRQFSGYVHHRWYLGGAARVELVSKLGFCELLAGREYVKNREEILYHWQGTLPYWTMSRLGPDVEAVVEQYQQWLRENISRIPT